MTVEQTYKAIVAKLETRKKIVENWDAAPREISALLAQVEWLWEQYETWDNGGGDGSLFEAQLTRIAKELGL